MMEVQKQDEPDADVLIIGAGMAGLAAARSLAAKGWSVLVLEAQARVGGRILTSRIGDEVIELGAEFVHGKPPRLLALIEEAGLTAVERAGSFVQYRNGAFYEDDSDDGPDESVSVLEQLGDLADGDLSFAEYLDELDTSEEKRASAIGFVEGFNAADYRTISTRALARQQRAEDASEGDRSFHVQGGYDQLPTFLAAKIEEHGGRLRLDTRVNSIAWQPGKVVAKTNQGSFTARRAVIAIPLGVLLSGAVEFKPALPEAVRNVFLPAGPIRMGSALRFTMIFREQFWRGASPQPAMSELSFLIARQMVPPVWWTPYPEESHALTGWIGGPQAMELAGLSSAALAERGCESLAKMFQLEPGYLHGLVKGCYLHDWSADRNSLGAYSYVAKDGLAAPGMLAQPFCDTLYFAGEHTATDGHWGTVHAALDSGLRAADQIVHAGE